MRITIDGSPEELSSLALELVSKGLSLPPIPEVGPDQESGSGEAEEGSEGIVVTEGPGSYMLMPGEPLPGHWKPKDVLRYCKGRKLRHVSHEDSWYFIPRGLGSNSKYTYGEYPDGSQTLYYFHEPSEWSLV